MWHQRWFLMILVLCYYVKSQELKPVQVVYNQKEKENVCFCGVSGKIIQIGMVYKPCDEKYSIEGKNLVKLIERKQEIAVYSPQNGVHSNVCDSVHVKEKLNGEMAEAELYCVWKRRPGYSYVSCVCTTFPFGMVETKKEDYCGKNVTLALEDGDEKQADIMLSTTAFVDKEVLVTVVSSRERTKTDTAAEIVKTRESDITITPSVETTAINWAEMTNEKSVNSLNVTKHKLVIHEPKSDNENSLFNVQSIKDKIKTLVKKVVYSDISSNSDLDMVVKKLKKEVVKEITGNVANITKKLCPFNATEAVKTLKDLKEEYDMLKFILGESLGYVITAFVTVLLTFCSVFVIAVLLCICLSLIFKEGQNELTEITRLNLAEFVSVSSVDQEVESDIGDSIV